MTKVQIKNHKIWVDSEPISLLAGEVHYWRLNPQYWKEILSSVKEMGVDIISTYIPWEYHEIKKQSFDFMGETYPTRNLKAFLDLTRDMNFKLVIRPGPYIYSEWPQDGVPKYAHQHHRLHPQFLKEATVYLEEVCKVIAPYQATQKNGHIILLQADNEVDPWPDFFGKQYGLEKSPGFFQEFIKDLYKNDLKELNQSWGTSYKSFDEAQPFMATMLSGEKGLPLQGSLELRRHIDYFKFKYDYTRKIAKWTVAQYKKFGIKVPIYMNTYPFFYAHDWKDLQKECDAVGIDIYPSNEFSEDKHEFRKYCDKLRYLSSISELPFIAEFQSGVWHGHHYQTGVLTPNHYRLISYSALLAGVKGWSWYMLVNRDNWYMSPINERGEKRGELFDVFKEVVNTYKKMDPPNLKKQTDIAATYHPIQYATKSLDLEAPEITALNDADIDYEIYDPRFQKPNKKVLFYAGSQWLEKTSQKNLLKYVKDGGVLVAFKNFPRKDEAGESCSSLGFYEPVKTLFEFKKPVQLKLLKSLKSISVLSSVYIFKPNKKDQMIEVDIDTYGKVVIGYIKTLGKGRILHLGVEPTKEVMEHILSYLKVRRYAHCNIDGIHTAVFKNKKKQYLVVVNNGVEAKDAVINIGRAEKVLDLSGNLSFSILDKKKGLISVRVGAKDGKVLQIG